MYFTLELDGRRKTVRAKSSASIGQVTELAFGPTNQDARVVVATQKSSIAKGALGDARPTLWQVEVA